MKQKAGYLKILDFGGMECCFVIVAPGFFVQYEGVKMEGDIEEPNYNSPSTAQSTYTLWKKVAILKLSNNA